MATKEKCKRQKINRIVSRKEFEKILDQLMSSGDYREAYKVIVKNKYREEFEQAAALLDWLLKGGPNFKLMQVKLVMIARAFFHLGVGDFDKYDSSDEMLNDDESKLN